MKGLVCKLFKSKDKRFQIALESAAGGRVSKDEFTLNFIFVFEKYIATFIILAVQCNCRK